MLRESRDAVERELTAQRRARRRVRAPRDAAAPYRARCRHGRRNRTGYVTNVLRHPSDPRVFRVRSSNPIFRERIGRMYGADALMASLALSAPMRARALCSKRRPGPPTKLPTTRGPTRNSSFPRLIRRRSSSCCDARVISRRLSPRRPRARGEPRERHDGYRVVGRCGGGRCGCGRRRHWPRRGRGGQRGGGRWGRREESGHETVGARPVARSRGAACSARSTR